MVYTSYFSNLKNLINLENTKFVSIAGKSADEFIELMNKDPEKFIQYKKLAPKYSWWKEWHDNGYTNMWYINKYNETVLSLLNPNEVYSELTNDNFDVILLCWEGKNKFCHRKLVAQWLENNLNIKVKEL